MNILKAIANYILGLIILVLSVVIPLVVGCGVCALIDYLVPGSFLP